MSSVMAHEETIHWLMEGDPAIRWQVMRDLLDAPAAQWKREQARVATDGWGRRLLDCRGQTGDSAGMWGGGIYTPKWTSTTYTLLLLREMGIPRDTSACRQGAACILDYETRGAAKKMMRERAEWVWEVLDLCLPGMYLGLLAYFDVQDKRVDGMVGHLLEQQMADGGWNCKQRSHDAHHSSLHTTMNVLDGLADYAEFRGKKAAVRVAEPLARAHEFILEHRLFKSDKTGEVIHPAFTKFSFPPRWHWDVLRGLTHLRRLNVRDERLQDAIDLLRAKRSPDGRWKLENHHAGKEFFKLEKLGQPSRWNTLRALRVLRWWDDAL